ncbi:hypothetical protein Slin14017_G096160 [Septoria linicola]|nr:hypothetical protein Slin14017_G096160 [Septoria linicola]
MSTDSAARQHFLAGIVEFRLSYGLASRNTLGQLQTMVGFDPFDAVFLHTAIQKTIDLLALLCRNAHYKKNLLHLPAEIRVQIYDRAIEEHWASHYRHTRSQKPWPWKRARSKDWEHEREMLVRHERLFFSTLEPPVFRTCKLLREEGLDVYEKFMRGCIGSKLSHNPERLWNELRKLMEHCVYAMVAYDNHSTVWSEPLRERNRIRGPEEESAVVELKRLLQPRKAEADKRREEARQVEMREQARASRVYEEKLKRIAAGLRRARPDDLELMDRLDKLDRKLWWPICDSGARPMEAWNVFQNRPELVCMGEYPASTLHPIKPEPVRPEPKGWRMLRDATLLG